MERCPSRAASRIALGILFAMVLPRVPASVAAAHELPSRPDLAAESAVPASRVETADGSWEQVTKTTFPRSLHGAIHDPVRHRMIVFGGFDGSNQNDVWALSLAGEPTWTALTPGGPPPSKRSDHSTIYDPLRDRLLVFGGGGSLNDVWSLSFSGAPSWTSLAPMGPAPTGRYDHSAIYDPVRDRMIVFGGRSSLGGVHDLDDAWALSLSGDLEWVPLSPAGTPPSARFGHTAIYDPVRDRMVVFGGYPSDNLFLDDTWTLSLGDEPAWTPIAATGFPGAGRVNHTAIYDPVRDRMVVFAGHDGGPTHDAWVLPLDGAPVWTPLAPTGPQPPDRSRHTAIYDPLGDRMVAFGGAGGGFDVWGLSLAGSTTWAELTPGGRPPGVLGAHGAVHDPLRDRMLVYGGEGGGGYPSGDVWALSLAGVPAWARIAPLGTAPSARQYHSTVYDPVRDRLVVFGGSDGILTEFGDVWALALTDPPAWVALAPSGTPPGPRWGHSAVYDPVGDRMVVFGGRDDDGYYNDVWTLSLAGAGAWSKLSPSGTAPPARHGQSAIFDPLRNRMLVFGGSSETFAFPNVAWALSLSGSPAWTQVAASGIAPSARRHHSAVYDAARDRMVVFGGWDGSERDDTWALALDGGPAWSQLSPAEGPPPARDSHRAIYDPARDRMVMFGASTLIEVWALEFGAPVGVEPSRGARSVRLGPAWPNPAGDRVRLRLEMPRRGIASVAVFDLSGRRVAVLAESALEAGEHALAWDARDARGRRVPAGVYVVAARVGERTQSRRVVIAP